MDIITDLVNFIKSLTFVDFILYFSVLILLILIVSLIYIIRTSSDEELEEESNDELDLVALSKEIDEHPSYNVELTDYETEQEEKAIISYDELIKQHKNYALNYEMEQEENGINIKKIDNLNPVNETKEEDVKPLPRVISYEREEEFLKVLQQLNKLLN